MWKLRSGQPESARASLQEALRLNPTDVRGLDALRQSYPKDGSTALLKVKEYAAQQPKSAPIQDFLGTMLLAKGDRSGARKAFEAAKAVDPSFLLADLSLVQVDVVEGRVDDGLKKLHAVLDGGNESPMVRLWLGNLELRKGNKAAAIEHFQKVIGVEPDNAQALNNLAYLLSERGDQGEQALQYARRAVELAPDEATYYDTLGWILYQKGLYTPAIQYLERAAAGRWSVLMKYHLSMAYAKAGDTRRGRATLDAALKLNPSLPEAKTAQEVVGKSR
jgi:tetratricopeptide (TPR) repeat protein